jgi:hypothetical protein
VEIAVSSAPPAAGSLAFMSGNHVDPDMAAEIFVLDGEL